MTARALIICEARADFEIAAALADRLAVEAIDWLEPEIIEHVRIWLSGATGSPFVAWRDLKRTIAARGHRVRPRSRFAGEPGAADAAAADKALQLALLESRADAPTTAVFLVRDSDADGSRRTGLEQARQRTPPWPPWPFDVVIGLAHPKREAWVLAGFEPENQPERERLAEQRRVLGFDPTERSDELVASSHGAKRDAKRVLDELTEGEPRREERCWVKTALAVLRERGGHNGLAAFLADLEQRWLRQLGALRGTRGSSPDALP